VKHEFDVFFTIFFTLEKIVKGKIVKLPKVQLHNRVNKGLLEKSTCLQTTKNVSIHTVQITPVKLSKCESK